MTDDDLQNYLDELGKEADLEFERERQRQAEAVETFESTIANLMKSGAGTRERAIMWLRTADDDPYLKFDDDYFCHEHGLPYGYLNQ